jgi:hypothetical protein
MTTTSPGWAERPGRARRARRRSSRRRRRRPPRARRHRTGGDDHRVGAAALDLGRGRVDAVLDRHAQATALVELVADQIAELGPVRHRGRQADLAAGVGLAFEHGHVVAVAGGGDRGLQPGRSGPDHQDPSSDRDRPRLADPFGLAPGAGVLDAAEPAVETHPADALLVAAQAQAGVVGEPGAGLGHEVGVGDLAAHHADQVALPFGERPLGLQRVLEPTDARRPAGRPPCGSRSG